MLREFSPAFRIALDFLLKEEGGYANRSAADDPGGETNAGITHLTLDDYRHDFPEESMPESVRDLSPEQVSTIYRDLYWDECRCGDMPPCIALAVFNSAVQSGPNRAVKLLQRLLGVRDDGTIGPMTMRALRSSDCKTLLPAYLAEQQFFEMGLSNWNANRRGWTLRLFRTAINSALLGKQLSQQDRNV